MSRKGSTPQRSVLPDPKHGSETIARFINMVMKSGKKSIAEKIVYGAMDVIGEKNPNALESSRRRWATSRRPSRSSRVASAAPPTRCRSKCVVAPHGAGHALADRLGAQARREHHAAQAGG